MAIRGFKKGEYKHSPKTLLKMSKSLKGRKSPNEGNKGDRSFGWKGGRLINKGEYVLIYCPTHPYARDGKYVCEHRLIMEKHLGRILSPIEVVHHINGNTKDNRIENLMLFSSNGKHRNYHRWNLKILKQEK